MQTVFHLVQSDEGDQKTTLSMAENLSTDDSVEMDDIAVVAQAGGIDPVMADGTHSDVVERLVDAGISFKACQNTLEGKDLDESNLIDGVEPVPTGVGELTRLQSDGYAYIRP